MNSSASAAIASAPSATAPSTIPERPIGPLEHRLHVGLVGWFRRRNFGDDLMGIQIAMRLRASGFDVSVLGMSRQSAEDFGIDTIEDVDTFVDRCDVVVYAGGGLFTCAHGAMEEEDGFGADMIRLCARIRRAGRELALISVGGDGSATRASRLTASQLAFLKTASLITFRNEEDLPWAQTLRLAPAVYPDIVWRSARDLGITSRPKSLVVLHNQSRKRRLVTAAAGALARLRPSSSFRPIVYRCEYYEPEQMSPGEVCFTSVRSALSMAAEARICFTNRLHLGIVVLSLGGQTFLTSPERKARLVFAREGWSRRILGAGIGDFASVLRREMDFVSGSGAGPDPKELERLARQANGHFRALNAWLGAIASARRSVCESRQERRT